MERGWVHCTDSIRMGRLGKGLGGDMSAAVAEGTAKGKTAGWQDQVYDLLRRHNVTQFAYVPDAGHKILIDRSLADPGVQSVALTTEEEGVALLAGARLRRARGGLLLLTTGAGGWLHTG